MTNAELAAPATRAERHELIDALRGFALCGVLLANMAAFSMYEYVAEAAQKTLPSAQFDRIAENVLQLLLTHKAVTVFSILFGLGFAMQLERAQARGADGLRVFLRRMAVLLAIGLLHTWFWWGDILLIYAIAGFAMVPMRKLPDRWLVWGGFLVALAGTALVRWWFGATSAKTGPLSRPEVFADTLQALSSPSLLGTFEGNAGLLRWWLPLGGLMLVLFALGRFMLGYWAGRRGLLQQPAAHVPLLNPGVDVAAGRGNDAAAVLASADQTSAARTEPGRRSGGMERGHRPIRTTAAGHRLRHDLRIVVSARRLAQPAAALRTGRSHGAEQLPDADGGLQRDLLWLRIRRRPRLWNGVVVRRLGGVVFRADGPQPLVAGAFPFRPDGMAVAHVDLRPLTAVAITGIGARYALNQRGHRTAVRTRCGCTSASHVAMALSTVRCMLLRVAPLRDWNDRPCSTVL